MKTTEGFSVPTRSNNAARTEKKIDQIKTVIFESNDFDASTLPIRHIIRNIEQDSNTTLIISCISFASDFVPTTKFSASKYHDFTSSRHEDCINLFDNYKTQLIRCEKLNEYSINIRWNATWIPSGSTWLYSLADFAGWKIHVKSPDPAVISTFSWKAVFDTFSSAFSTGDITLPISCIEGNTVVSIKHVQDKGERANSNDFSLAIKDSIDLVSEADKNRIQNRKVAQELASWMDVSRRPPEFNVDDWAGLVRQRILSSVPGAGALDVDPNESDSEGLMALIFFGFISAVVFGLSFQLFTLPELVGGTGSIPSRCDDAEILEFGSGYLSECFGPFGDPTL